MAKAKRKKKGRPRNIEFDGDIYIPFQNKDIEWGWKKSDLPKVIEMWNKGVSLPKIATKMNRSDVETGLLIMSLEIEGLVDERPGAAWGEEA